MADMTPTTAPALPPLPKQRRGFICTKCGSRTCEPGREDEMHPPCNTCGYLGFAQDLNYSPEETQAYALAAIAAQPHGAMPGWQLVPVEPTSAMLTELSGEWHPSRHTIMKIRWEVMLAASPSPLGREAGSSDHLAGFDEDEAMDADRAADLLEHYAEFIKTDIPDLERHPYLPEIDDIAASMRKVAAKMSSDHFVPCAGGGVTQPLTDDEVIALARIASHTNHYSGGRCVWMEFSPTDILSFVKALNTAPRPDAPTSQINPGSATREDGHGS